MVNWFSFSFWLFVCLFFALWLQLTTFMEGVALWAHNLLFLLVSSYVYFHCYLLFMVAYGLSSLDWLAGFGDGGKMWEGGL